MGLSREQIQILSGRLDPRRARVRPADGRILSYVEGWPVLAEANRVFGLDGWDRETLEVRCVWHVQREDHAECAYLARVRICVRAGDERVIRESSGAGRASAATSGEAHAVALTRAESDATKRALATFGYVFGLALCEAGRVGGAPPPDTARPTLAAWRVLDENGRLSSAHLDPVVYCARVRRMLETRASQAALDAVWRRNAATFARLRRSCPALTDGRGRHYADLLGLLYDARRAKLSPRQDDAPTASPPVPTTPADRTAAEPVPTRRLRRVRDPAHLAYVRAKPCLVCGRRAAEAHHLRFVQPRGLGLKPSDEWAVPLCTRHHRALHAYGDERAWWAAQRIDAVAAAERLWHETHARPATGTSTGNAAAGDDHAPAHAKADAP